MMFFNSVENSVNSFPSSASVSLVFSSLWCNSSRSSGDNLDPQVVDSSGSGVVDSVLLVGCSLYHFSMCSTKILYCSRWLSCSSRRSAFSASRRAMSAVISSFSCRSVVKDRVDVQTSCWSMPHAGEQHPIASSVWSSSRVQRRRWIELQRLRASMNVNKRDSVPPSKQTSSCFLTQTVPFVSLAPTPQHCTLPMRSCTFAK
mmetsp:Transcript_40097/g.100696  ORF Transcript_40097/g.100696 Transcript_40097/m.100696 type:complete len:202 (+) Transcript_40097:102-707(+)